MASAPKDTRRDPRAFLKVVSGTHAHPDIPLPNDRPFVIGRKRGDYLIEDGLASAAHAQILPDDNGWVIRDLGSTNGTLVDGRLVREGELRPGAEITIGKTRFVLFVGLAEEAEEEQALEGKDTVAEGVLNTISARALAEREGVDMPIVLGVHRILFEAQPPHLAISELMSRELRAEQD